MKIFDLGFRAGVCIGAAGMWLALFSLAYSSFQSFAPPKPTNLFLGAFTCAIAIDTRSEHIEETVLATDYGEPVDGGEARCVYSATVTPLQDVSTRKEVTHAQPERRGGTVP